ncbi:MAG: DUF3108 domain-containing protein [Planctomycetota bacterium]
MIEAKERRGVARIRAAGAVAALVVLAGPSFARANGQDAGDAATAGPAAQDDYRAPLEIDLTENGPILLVPQEENLTFVAQLELAGIQATVGRVTVKSGVKPYRAGLLAPKPKPGEERYTGWISAQAKGEYGVYTLDSLIETTLQPQAWPSLVHRFEQRGTEKRRREILAGTRDGQGAASYRSDTEKGAPKGARVWGPLREFAAPEGTVDTISAPYIVRSMIRDGRNVATFHMLDKERLWQVALTLGDPIPMATPSGMFEAREVHLATRQLERYGEPVDEGTGEEFSGPFGIEGDIRMFVESHTGVPLAVKGRLPAGPFEIQLDIRLEKYEGTPPEFAVLPPSGTLPPADGASDDGTDGGGDDDGGGDGSGPAVGGPVVAAEPE